MKVRVILLMLLISSCSSFNKTLFVSSLIGGTVGATGGMVFSPNEESINKNAYLFGILGAVAGVGVAYMLDDSKPKQAVPMILDEPTVKRETTVPLFDFAPELKGVRPEVNFKPVSKYEVPLEKLPPELEGKVKKQYLIEYQSEAKTIELENRTIEVGPFKAWEHVYEK